MGMRSDDERSFSVQMPAHRDFLGSRFRVEIDENVSLSVACSCIDQFIGFAKRTIDRRQKRPALQINDRQLFAVGLDDRMRLVPAFSGGNSPDARCEVHRRSTRKYLCYPTYDCPS